ncbi:MAG: GNAT family N-acetyltransferase [Clostridia bacterium]|nr:GNAT family N-acetyltransferase [Clostridia bacterium]
MIQGKWFPQGADLNEAAAVRRAVFGRGEDPLDGEAQNVVVYSDDTPAASGRLWWRDGSFWIGDIGVLPDFRGRKLGDLTLRLLLFKAQNHYAREVRLRTPEETEGFFARLGFREDLEKGDAAEMFLPGDEIQLDSCKSCKKADCPNRKD